MLKRFLNYYKSHMPLFVLDISASVLGAGLAVLIPRLTRFVLKKVYVQPAEMRVVGWTLGLMLVIVSLHALLSYVRLKWGHILGVRMEADMRNDLFGHIQKLSFNYFDSVKTGHLMSRISNDLNTIAESAHHGPEDILLSVCILTGAFIFMFMISPPLAGIALIPIPVMAIWGMIYGRKMKRGFRRVRREIADMNSSVENSVQGIREVKSYANEDEEISKFAEVNSSFLLAKEKMYEVLGRFVAGMVFLREAYFLVVIAGGAWLIYRGSLDTADLAAFILYVYLILNPIQRLVNFTENFQQATASFERFVEIMDIEPDIVDAKDAHTFDPVVGEVEISGLNFKYAESHELILSDINMRIPARSTVGIVGESGAGKTTIAALIPRFYEADKGTITLDGHDVMDLKQRFLRSKIGIVQQNVFLFDSTIRDNILYGKPGASDEELVEAARKANILEFIEGLPDGFETLVGERGIKLSGGQKQRISIARVFLKDPAVFIFDEATSSLDSESEAAVQKSLELLREDRTTVIIAHRLSTVKCADYLYVLKNGKVVEQGTHEELIAKAGYYHSLYTINVF
jgi:ATP-binding cassette subfamily B protein